MARPGLFKHRKFARLASRLRSPILAVGVLETLWYVCGETCDDRVGTAADLAFALKWTDKRIDIACVLHESGFLDCDADGHYVVHDFWDHCPQFVKRRREREDARRADGAATKAAVVAGRTMASQRLDNGSPVASTHVSVRSSAVQCSAIDDLARTTTQTTIELHPSSLPARTPALNVESPPPSIAPRIPIATPPPPGAPVPVGDLWDHWRQAAEQQGVLEPALISPKHYAALRGLFDRHDLDVLRRAVTAFWTTPHFEAKRQIGMFAANAGQIVAHVTSGATHPYGTKAPPPEEESTAVWAAKMAARIGVRA